MFCKNCGEKLDEGTRFCTKCGTKVEAVVPVQPVPQNNTATYVTPNTSNKKKKSPAFWVVFGVIAFVVGGILIGVITGLNELSQSSNELANVVDVDLGTLLKELETNPAVTDLLYKGKTLRLRGTVQNIDDEGFWLAANNATWWDSVSIKLLPAERAKLLLINNKQRVVVRGVYEGTTLGFTWFKQAVLEEY